MNKEVLKVRVKKLVPEAQIPKYAHYGDAGMDVVATSMTVTDDYVEYGTGLAFEVPKGYVMLIFPRSSNSKQDLLLCNSVGVLDSTYRGELKVRYKRTIRMSDEGKAVYLVNAGTVEFVTFDSTKRYNTGDRVCQIMIIPYPEVTMEEAEELSDTDRGAGGFGSTGK